MYKVFVGNLPWITGPRELGRYCRRFGRIKSCEVVFDWKTGFSKGYGFVNFRSKNDMNAMLNEKEHIIDGGLVDVKEVIKS